MTRLQSRTLTILPNTHTDFLHLQFQPLPAFQDDKESHHPLVLKCHKTQTRFLNDFANTQTAGFQTQTVPYIEMVRFIAENNIENPMEIQKFDRLGYSFRSDLSSDSEYVFERKKIGRASCRERV